MVLCYTVAGLFVVLTALKVVPLYIESYTVKSVLESLDERAAIHQSTPVQVRGWIRKGLKMNGIQDLPEDAVRVRRKGAFLAAKINYERRIDFLGNIDMVLSFENSWKIKQQ